MLSDSACLDFILEDMFGELTTDILEEQCVKMGIHGWVFSAHFVTDERAACQSHGSWCTRCFQTEAIPQRRERLRAPLAESSSDQGAAARLFLCGGAVVTRKQAKAKIAKNDLVQDLKVAPSVLQATLLIEPGFPVGTFSPTRCLKKKCALCCVLCCALCCVLCVLWFWCILKQEARSKPSKARK